VTVHVSLPSQRSPVGPSSRGERPTTSHVRGRLDAGRPCRRGRGGPRRRRTRPSPTGSRLPHLYGSPWDDRPGSPFL